MIYNVTTRKGHESAMRKKVHSGIFVFLFLLMFSCAERNSGGNSDSLPISIADNKNNSKFPYIDVSKMITDPLEATRRYTTNFWDEYIKIPADLKEAIDTSEFEQAYSNYIYALNSLQQATKNPHAGDAIEKALFIEADSLYQKGDKTLLINLLKYSEKYLYDPNSPFLNEELYIPVLETILMLKSLDEYEKMQYDYQLNLAKLNRIGTRASDFEFKYLDRGNGTNNAANKGILKSGSLYALKGDYTLIFFNNPDCHSCAEMLEGIKSARIIEDLAANGKLKILAIYIDEQLDIWREKNEVYPDNWIYAYDNKLVLRNNDIYGIRAIPSFYLLDKDKNVILKDAPNPEPIITYFANTLSSSL